MFIISWLYFFVARTKYFISELTRFSESSWVRYSSNLFMFRNEGLLMLIYFVSHIGQEAIQHAALYFYVI